MASATPGWVGVYLDADVIVLRLLSGLQNAIGETNHSANQSDNKVLLDQNYIYTETFITWYQRDTSALSELQIIIIV